MKKYILMMESNGKEGFGTFDREKVNLGESYTKEDAKQRMFSRYMKLKTLEKYGVSARLEGEELKVEIRGYGDHLDRRLWIEEK